MKEQARNRSARKKAKQRNKKLICVAAVAAVVLAVLVAVVFLLPGKGDELPRAHDPERGPLKELTVQSQERQGETMVVDTSYLPVEYPYAFSDLIQVEAINQGNQTALAFYAMIAGESRELYTLWFNGKDGQTVGAFDLQDGEKPVVVTLAFYNPDAELEGDDRITFFATQETINDVLSAMKQDKNFTTYE